MSALSRFSQVRAHHSNFWCASFPAAIGKSLTSQLNRGLRRKHDLAAASADAHLRVRYRAISPARNATSLYGMMRVYLIPSNDAPIRSPVCAKFTAITGAKDVVVSARRLSPRSLTAYSISAPAAQPGD